MNMAYWLGALLALLSSTGAWAVQPDGKAVANHPSLVREITESASAGVLDIARTRKLIRAIMMDNQYDAQEQDMVTELMRPGFEALAVATPSGEIVQLRAPDADARALLELFVQPPDLNALWLKDGGSMVKLAEMAHWSSSARRQVMAFAGAKLHEDWKSATIHNSYQPLRGTLDHAWSMIKDVEPVRRRLAAGVLYDAMREVDRARNDSLPDFLYNWLNPSGEFVRKGGQ